MTVSPNEATARGTSADRHAPTDQAHHECECRCHIPDMRVMAQWYCGVSTLLVTAGIGLHRLVERDQDPEIKFAYKTLREFVIRPIDKRASDEAEEFDHV